MEMMNCCCCYGAGADADAETPFCFRSVSPPPIEIPTAISIQSIQFNLLLTSPNSKLSLYIF